MPEEASILFVDDEASIRNLVRTLLRLKGFSVTCASCVEEARAILAKDSFDLMITDHMMPGGTGLDLIDTVHRTHPALITMLMTGLGQDEIDCNTLAQGSTTAIIEKPFNTEKLVATIRRALDNRPS